METKVGKVNWVNKEGTAGQFLENGTNRSVNFEIIHPTAYVVKGDSLKVIYTTRSNKTLNIFNPSLISIQWVYVKIWFPFGRYGYTYIKMPTLIFGGRCVPIGIVTEINHKLIHINVFRKHPDSVVAKIPSY